MERIFKVSLCILGIWLVYFTVGIFTENKFAALREYAPDSHLVVTAKERTRQLECLARNIYYEAGNEHFEGKVAVAMVTLNRAASGRFPNDICAVIYQKTVFAEKVVCQFSWFCETAGVVKPIHTATFNESYEVAKKVLLEGFRLPSLKEAMYYHATYVSPNWNKPRITQIGNHIFYKEKS